MSSATGGAPLTGEEANEVEYLYTREIDELRDALIGETDADNYRQTIVRTALMQEFWKDENVQALVSQWAQATGLEKRALRLSNACEQIAELSGLDFRGEVLLQEEFTVEEDDLYAIEAAGAEWVAAYDDLMPQFDDPKHAAFFAQQAEEFVKNLGVTYPWRWYRTLRTASSMPSWVSPGASIHPRPLVRTRAPLGDTCSHGDHVIPGPRRREHGASSPKAVQ